MPATWPQLFMCRAPRRTKTMGKTEAPGLYKLAWTHLLFDTHLLRISEQICAYLLGNPQQVCVEQQISPCKLVATEAGSWS